MKRRIVTAVIAVYFLLTLAGTFLFLNPGIDFYNVDFISLLGCHAIVYLLLAPLIALIADANILAIVLAVFALAYIVAFAVGSIRVIFRKKQSLMELVVFSDVILSFLTTTWSWGLTGLDWIEGRMYIGVVLSLIVYLILRCAEPDAIQNQQLDETEQ
jgi:hypothetical protein